MCSLKCSVRFSLFWKLRLREVCLSHYLIFEIKCKIWFWCPIFHQLLTFQNWSKLIHKNQISQVESWSFRISIEDIIFSFFSCHQRLKEKRDYFIPPRTIFVGCIPNIWNTKSFVWFELYKLNFHALMSILQSFCVLSEAFKHRNWRPKDRISY